MRPSFRGDSKGSAMFCRWWCRLFHRKHHIEVQRWEANGLLHHGYRRMFCRCCRLTWTELIE
jgi:hypothetical protein